VSPDQPDPYLAQAHVVEGFRVLPPCVMFERIDEGGMGAVYRGWDLSLPSTFELAVKCLKPDLVKQDSLFVSRFEREARSGLLLTHENLIRIYGLHEYRGQHFLTMELVRGESAHARVKRRGRLDLGQALAVVFGAARGLGCAHRAGFVHRDIKPGNLLISKKGEVKVADLGLAKPIRREDSGSTGSGWSSDGAGGGTYRYMPPEQLANSATIGPAADVWALGATLYYLLAGVDAITGDGFESIAAQILFHPFPDIRAVRPEVPLEVAAVIGRATALDPAQRYRDADRLAEEIVELDLPFGSLADPDAGSDRRSPTQLRPTSEVRKRLRAWVNRQKGNVAPISRRSESAPRADPRPGAAAGSRRRALVFLTAIFGLGGLIAAYATWGRSAYAEPPLPPETRPPVDLVVPATLRVRGGVPEPLVVEVTPGSKVSVDGRHFQFEPAESQRALALDDLDIWDEETGPLAISIRAERDGHEPSEAKVRVERESVELHVRWTELADLGLAPLGSGYYWTDRDSVVLTGQCDLRFDALDPGDGTTLHVHWPEDKWFECTLPLPQEGLQDFELLPSLRFHHAQPLKLLIDVDREPVALVWREVPPEMVAAEVASIELSVEADPRLDSVVVRAGGAEVDLEYAQAAASFFGTVPLEPGPNAIAVVGIDRLGRHTELSLVVDRARPAIAPDRIAWTRVRDGAPGETIESGERLILVTGDALEVVVAPEGCEIEFQVDGRVVAQRAATLTSVEELLDSNQWQELTVVARNSAGETDPVSCLVLLDTEPPSIQRGKPMSSVLAGESFTVQGRWSDPSGLSRITVDGRAAEVSIDQDDPHEGTWMLAGLTLTATRDLEVVAVDNAGLPESVWMTIKVLPAPPRTRTFPGFSQLGTEANGSGYPMRIVHGTTGIELVAIGADGGGPLLYAGVVEVSERQFSGGGGGSDESKTSIRFKDVLAWCDRQGFDLPTHDEWDRIHLDRQARVQRMVTGTGNVGEFVKDCDGASALACCYRGQRGERQRTGVGQQELPNLGFRVVYRP
jgi:serine/threonine protein kinase